MQREYLGGRVIVECGDLTALRVDAIVNAANATLLGGGGVDGAIHRAGGPAILDACRELRRSRFPKGLPVGEAVMTTAGDLPARFVIHTVGPVFGEDIPEDALLASCYRKSLLLAEGANLRSIAFPAISTGAYGYPKPQAAEVASRAIASSLSAINSVQSVRLVFFSQSDADVFARHQKFPDRG